MYNVKYVTECTSKVKSFTTKKKAMKFVANFLLKNQFAYNAEDNWIDMVFKGTIVYLDPGTPKQVG